MPLRNCHLSTKAFLTLFILSHHYVNCQVGVVFSPFVRSGDTESSRNHNKEDVKVMLKIVAKDGYNNVATYGVGAPGEQYQRDSTWKRSSSVVHTAIAAAEINRELGKRNLTVFQGLFIAEDDNIDLQRLDPEIRVGFEMAERANSIFQRSVASIVFPSSTGFNAMFSGNKFPHIQSVSVQTRRLGMTFGARVWDCRSILSHDPNNADFRKLLALFDFLICQRMPNTNTYSEGPEGFYRNVIAEISSVKEAIKRSEQAVRIFVETGWPGQDGNDFQHNTVKNMRQYWDLMRNWTRGQETVTFMHEAFDNPWKSKQEHVILAAHYGLYAHSQTDDSSAKAYILKEPLERTWKKSTSNDLIIGLTVGLALFVLVVILILVLYKRLVRFSKARGKLSEDEIRQFIHGVVTNEVVTEEGGNNPWTRVPYNRDFELTKNQFVIDNTNLLGSGAFGSVYKGKITGLVNDVAFKTTKPDCPLSALRGLLSEIKILIYLGKHENIVSICGAHTANLTEGSVYLATELCSNGSLEKYLRAHKSDFVEVARYVDLPPGYQNVTTISDSQLLQWSTEIGSAMEYISSKNVIHADLAARNVLLTANLTAKVTDFGLSRRLYEYTEYVKQQQEPLPWRWMAVESLRQLEFSVKSDVWSFGVTLWEIFTMGDVPYPGLSWHVEFATELQNGLRLQKPSFATDDLYEIMTTCWALDPVHRPSFQMLKKSLQTLAQGLKK